MTELILINTKHYGESELVHAKRVTLEQAADEMGLDPNEIEWCLEEYNRCDSPPFVLIKEDYGDEDHPVGSAS